MALTLKILLHSIDPQYVLKNLPWLIGSLGRCLAGIVMPC